MSSLTSLLVTHPVLVSGSLQSAYIYISKTEKKGLEGSGLEEARWPRAAQITKKMETKTD